MKKLVFSLIALAFLAVSCGPSAEEIKAKKIADSTAVADSVTKATKAKAIADSIAKADSTRKADSIAKAAPVKTLKTFKKK